MAAGVIAGMTPRSIKLTPMKAVSPSMRAGNLRAEGLRLEPARRTPAREPARRWRG